MAQLNFNVEPDVSICLFLALELFNRTEGTANPLRSKSSFVNFLILDKLRELSTQHPDAAQTVAAYRRIELDPALLPHVAERLRAWGVPSVAAALAPDDDERQ